MSRPGRNLPPHGSEAPAGSRTAIPTWPREDRTVRFSYAETFTDPTYLGPLAVADVQSQLVPNFFTVGFVSAIVTDPGFDHIDYIRIH